MINKTFHHNIHHMMVSDSANNNGTREKVCILIPMTSRDQNWLAIADTCIARYALPSLEATITSSDVVKYEYTAYAGYDTSDTFFTSADDVRLHKANRKFKLVLKSFDNPLQKPGPVMNGLSLVAYNDGCDYMYRINDDTELLTPAWTTRFIDVLLQYDPPLVGVVGPACHEGNTAILTHDFVHRTHLDIFSLHHYPPVLTDYWLDDWITQVYGENRTKKLPDVSVIHRLNPMRYVVNFANQASLANEVQTGGRAIAQHVLGGHQQRPFG